jgi:CheY-like chemotaxis protein
VRQLKILLVDDEAGLRRTFQMLLEDEGHRVVTAADGREASTLLYIHLDFDLLITDQNMPNMRGEELTRLARQRDPSLRIIAMSGDDPEVVRRVLLLAGADRVFAKHDFALRFRKIIAELFPDLS